MPLFQHVFVVVAVAASMLSSIAEADTAISSPDARAAATVSLSPKGIAQWSMSWRGKAVFDLSPIGLRFAGSPPSALQVTGVVRRSHDGIITGLLGKASSARDHYNEAVIALRGGAMPLELVVRAYDDGVAYRWRFQSAGPFKIIDEDAGFGVPPSARAWVATTKDFKSSYEEYYRTGALAEAAPDGALLTLPVLVEHDGVWAGISEAALHDWAGLYLVRHDGRSGLGSHLSPLLDQSGVAVTSGAGLHVSPWRVVMLGDVPGRLIESNLVTLLNPPPDRRDWSWVKPGKTSFPWWNDYVWPGQGFTPGLNTATMDAYIDFDADQGIPFHTLDGFKDEAWYGGPIGPDGSFQNLTRARPEIDMAEILARADRRGVRLRLWCHWLPLRVQLDAALDQWEKWGIAGLMIDFMNRDDQEMVAFYDEVARKAADHHLTVVYHGAHKPTGANRTWPNVLSYEAVRGTEYNKFDHNPGSTPVHEATTPFVRMLAGPMDIHEGGFDAVTAAAFRIRYSAPQVMGTRARALATYVVEENELAMVADTPANYVDATEFKFIAQTPATWDETRVLAGEVGQYIVIARRKGGEWWLGAITDGHARTVTVRLSMLQGTGWIIDGYADAGTTANSAEHFTSRVKPGGQLVLRLAEAGGYAARLSRIR